MCTGCLSINDWHTKTYWANPLSIESPPRPGSSSLFLFIHPVFKLVCMHQSASATYILAGSTSWSISFRPKAIGLDASFSCVIEGSLWKSRVLTVGMYLGNLLFVWLEKNCHTTHPLIHRTERSDLKKSVVKQGHRQKSSLNESLWKNKIVMTNFWLWPWWLQPLPAWWSWFKFQVLLFWCHWWIATEQTQEQGVQLRDLETSKHPVQTVM